jgi:farnesyl diphosphate synthase
LSQVRTDIYDNKCSWLIVKALEVGDESIRSRLAASYGRKGDSAAEARVKEIYREIKIAEEYHRYEEASYATLMAECEQMDARKSELPAEVVRKFIAKVYKRQK